MQLQKEGGGGGSGRSLMGDFRDEKGTWPTLEIVPGVGGAGLCDRA